MVEENLFEDFGTIKTKKVTEFLNTLGLNSNEKTLFILTKPNPKFWLASRNLENIEVTSATSLNIKQLLKTNNIILSTTGLKLINLTYGKSYT